MKTVAEGRLDSKFRALRNDCRGKAWQVSSQLREVAGKIGSFHPINLEPVLVQGDLKKPGSPIPEMSAPILRSGRGRQVPQQHFGHALQIPDVRDAQNKAPRWTSHKSDLGEACIRIHHLFYALP